MKIHNYSGDGGALPDVYSPGAARFQTTDVSRQLGFKDGIAAVPLWSLCWVIGKLARLHLNNLVSRTPVTADGPVVSLTTHGSRLRTVFLAIESIAAGACRPSRLILWLNEASVLDCLPSTLRRLKARGLEVRLCLNYGPHTKYYPYIDEEASFNVPLVTADDDVLYPRFWLQRLQQAFQNEPNVINCYFAREVALSESGIAGFAEWKECHSTQPRFRQHALGFSGVIYPPRFLVSLKEKGTGFLDCCPRADDLWLHVQAVRSGFRTRQISRRVFRFVAIPGKKDTALWIQNGQGGGNNDQVLKTYTARDIQILRHDSHTVVGNPID
jgi:hypothetical protein